jgi:hypothetical protein
LHIVTVNIIPAPLFVGLLTCKRERIEVREAGLKIIKMVVSIPC